MSLYTASSEGTQSVWHCLLCTYFPLPQSPMNTSHSQGLCVTVSQEQMFQRCKFPVHLKKAGEKGERYNFRKVSSGIHTLLGARESSFPSVCLCRLHLSREIPLRASRTPEIRCSQECVFNRNSSASSLGFIQVWPLEKYALGVWAIAAVLMFLKITSARFFCLRSYIPSWVCIWMSQHYNQMWESVSKMPSLPLMAILSIQAHNFL